MYISSLHRRLILIINPYNNLYNYKHTPAFKGYLNITKNSPIVKITEGFSNISHTRSDIFKAAGKVLFTPLMIILSPLEKRNEEDRKYNAAIVPIETGIALVTSLVTALAVGKGLEKLAKKGVLGEMYNIAKGDKANKYFNILKDRAFFIAGLITIPFTSKLCTEAFPRVISKFFPSLEHNKKKDYNYNLLYTVSLKKLEKLENRD